MDKRSLTSAQNGRKGGRKKGESTILREKGKDYIARRVEEEIGPLVEILLKKAKGGDMFAIKELFDRAWGKATQPTEMDLKGNLSVSFDNSLSDASAS